MSAANPAQWPPGNRGTLADRIRAALRPEFRVEVYVPEPDDPVLGGGRCAVARCDGWCRARGLCEYHHGRWRRAGRPDLGAFLVAASPRPIRAGPRRAECFDLRGLPAGLRLELAYALQCRADEHRSGLPPEAVHQVVRLLLAHRAQSLLERSAAEWRAALATLGPPPARSARAFVGYAHQLVDDLDRGADAESEYAGDRWDLRRIGMAVNRGPNRISFEGIAQPWLRAVAKRWARFRLATKVPSTVKNDVKGLARFAAFLHEHRPGAADESSITRAVLEAYLPWLAATGLSGATRVDDLVNLRTFLEHCRRHGWLAALPSGATLYQEDFPARVEPLPRFLSEAVMAQLESPANLARLPPDLRHLVVLLIETGLRVGDATALPFDAVVTDSVGWPCLRFLNSKVAIHQLLPLSAKAAEAVAAQQAHVRRRWPDGPPLLFPGRNGNPDGTRPRSVSAVSRDLGRWQADIDARDEAGQPLRATPHQFRHTFGTRLINFGVPQHVVQHLLGHVSPEMTATYAHLHDTTVRDAFERWCASRVNVTGELLPFDPGAPTADAEWIKHRLARIADSLPNGYCGRPPQQACPHPNACLTCPDFQTTAEFLPVHRQQLAATRILIATAEANGQFRLVENHRRVEANLERIVPALEALGDHEAPDAG